MFRAGNSRIRGALLRWMLPVVIVIAAAGIFIWRAAIHGRGSDNPPDQSSGPVQSIPLPEVVVVEMTPQRTVLTTELPGYTSPFLVAEIRPQVSGLILNRLFTEGADVEAGQTLYEIDPAPFQSSLQSAEANLISSQRAADQARAALEASRAAVARQQATLNLAKKNLLRQEALVADGAVSLSEYDQAVTESDVAEAALQAAAAQVTVNQEAVEAAEAAIQQAAAAVEMARINLGHTRIAAPISGRIGMSNVTVGALLTAYQSMALTSIQQLDPIYVDVTQSSVDLLRLRSRLNGLQSGGDTEELNEARLILEDDSQYPLPGALQFRDVTVNPSTGSVVLRIIFPNPDGLLLPGMYVRAVVTEGVVEQAILIPQEAVSRDAAGNAIALIVNSENRVEPRMLTLDRTIGGQWLVTAGLAPGDRVIVEGQIKARPGAEVRIAPLAPADPEPPAGMESGGE